MRIVETPPSEECRGSGKPLPVSGTFFQSILALAPGGDENRISRRQEELRKLTIVD
jgi:hypothetical protein